MKKDKRVDVFREEALDFVADNLSKMEDVFDEYMKAKEYDKAVALYMKLADKVIPALPTLAAESQAEKGKPDWAIKLESTKKIMESKV